MTKLTKCECDRLSATIASELAKQGEVDGNKVSFEHFEEYTRGELVLYDFFATLSHPDRCDMVLWFDLSSIETAKRDVDIYRDFGYINKNSKISIEYGNNGIYKI